MTSTWKRLGPVAKIIIVVVALLALWAVVGLIPLSSGGVASPR
jgi:hypothetical protein